ncbi:PAAR-like domain-containing protein [Pseudomonas chlororaphis]|uniref:PAAR-like domain-containing protein n=1 Tax=Pseudomonas chlororaphis TaxID=587753 RepID=UPI0004704687|nr:PAAR-like domain-containing protein [Pseudomonas chlororaphis]
MANEVFANGREISCKAASGKAICAFPDVCFTPPQAPPTPAGTPIPYPNTGMARDTSRGSRTVKITRREVMLKNKSYFRKSTGDEAGSAPKKGIVTSKNKGKMYFVSWSMDVKIEGENVVRHLDMSTHNHASDPGNTAPWTYQDRMALGMKTGQCNDEIDAAKTACGDDLNRKATCPPEGQQVANERKRFDRERKAGANEQTLVNIRKDIRRFERQLGGASQRPCQRALRCFLTPYDSGHCCPGQTPDHLIEVKCVVEAGANRQSGGKRPGWDNYDSNKAPCLCAEGEAATVSTHGVLSARRKVAMKARGSSDMNLDEAATIGAKSASTTFKGCSEKCLKAQLMDYHQEARTTPSATLRPSSYGMGRKGKVKSSVLARSAALMNG